MGRPTCVRAVDSWVVGAAGGSMALLRRRSIAEVGPRSAHIAGLPYASFADPSELAGAELELVSPRAGDPEAYACVRAGGRLFALTATCAANALGLVAAGRVFVRGRGGGARRVRSARPAARATPEGAARQLLDGAVEKIVAAVAEAARSTTLGRTCHSSRSGARARRSCRSSPSG